MKFKIQALVKRLVLWAIGDHITKTVVSNATQQAKHQQVQINNRFGEIQEHLKALQAIDVDYKDSGKLIIIAHVQGRDVVKILDIPNGYSLQEWKRLIAETESLYGIPLRRVDAPRGYDDFLWEGQQHRRPGGPRG